MTLSDVHFSLKVKIGVETRSFTCPEIWLDFLKIFICIVSQKQKERHEQEEKLYHYKKEKAEIDGSLSDLRRKEHVINETIGKLDKDIERCETTRDKIKAQGKKKAFFNEKLNTKHQNGHYPCFFLSIVVFKTPENIKLNKKSVDGYLYF